MNARTIPQGSLVTPREPILINNRTKAYPGQTFWVTCAVYQREAAQCIKIARNAGYAQAYTFADAEKYFSAFNS